MAGGHDDAAGAEPAERGAEHEPDPGPERRRHAKAPLTLRIELREVLCQKVINGSATMRRDQNCLLYTSDAADE